jgi:FtsP/CotA-like multicopper oxidase with cupredoxin domain
MFGSFIIEDPDDPIKKKYNYDREYTLVYSSHDVNFIREELNGMLTRMKERTYLNRNGRFDKERFGVFDTVDELMTSMKENGYEPPYLNTRKSPELPEENWFTVNGKSYPTTPIMYIREGEKIRVRLINAGELIHSLHLHGQDFFEVANDGIPLKNHIEMNTIPIYPGKTHDIVIDGYNRGIWTFHDHNTLRVTNNGRYPGGNLMTLVYEDLPEEERMIVPYSGNQMFNGMDNNNMMTWGGPKLPKITLDQ